jgi:predicted phosphodiesterase
MTKIGIIGDVHVGNHAKLGGLKTCGINERCESVLQSLDNAVSLANVEDVDALIILGDLFDNPRPSPQMIKRVQDAIEKCPTIIIAGNHDQCSDRADDNALGPLMAVSEVLDMPDVIALDGVDLICVPYQAGNCEEWLHAEVKSLVQISKAPKRLLVFHAGIIDDDTPSFLRDSSAAIRAEVLFNLCSEFNIDTAFAGHWHNMRRWEFFDTKRSKNVDVLQAGALVPTGWNNPGMDYGALYLYDVSAKTGENISTVTVPGPRFITASLDDDLGVVQGGKASGQPNKLYLRLQVTEKDVSLGETILKAGIQSGTIEQGILDISSTQTDLVAKKAACATRSAETLDEALAVYTEKMVLKGVEEMDGPEARYEIRERATEYMKAKDEG